MIYLGFDPGLSGGCAMIDDLGRASAHPMPVSGGEVDANALGVLVCEVLKHDSGMFAVVEKVGAMPKQGLSSTFNFGKGYGKILGVLGALGVRHTLVTPQAWKRLILAGSDHSKDAAIAWCRTNYPNVNLLASERCRVPHDGMADALCMAEFAKMAAR